MTRRAAATAPAARIPGAAAPLAAIVALAIAGVPARAAAPIPRAPAPAAAPAFQPPRYTRAQMEAALERAPAFRFVYGTRDRAAAPRLRERALRVAARLFGADSARVTPDTALDARALAAEHVFLLGGPRENRWTAQLAPALPVTFGERRFAFHGREYDRPGDAIHLAYPNPLAPGRFVLLVAGNSVDAIAGRGGALFGGEDWRIVRDGELARSGRFADRPRPWSYDPALDHDREAERARFERGLAARDGRGVRLRAAAGDGLAARVLPAAEALLARLDAAGFRDPAGGRVTLTLYPSLEAKGLLARDTRPEHADAPNVALAGRVVGRAGPDLESVASARLLARGADPESRFVRAGGVWWCGRFEGEPLAVAVSRLYHGRVLPRAAAAAAAPARWRSPLVVVPARALLLGALADVAGRRAPEAWGSWMRARAPGDLDSLAALARVPRAALERRYAALADSLARAGMAEMRRSGPAGWRPADGFQRGVCFAHTVSLERGYLSRAAAGELERLAAMGADAISLTPFGYLPSAATPEVWPTADGGVDGETDEALVEAARRARALGMKVWLKPHLWTRGWIGDLAFAPGDWPRFFEAYREFALHYALLAQREGLEGFVVGHELVSATTGFPDRWRALVADVRRVYTGTVTYGANWGDEVRKIAFWDALDVIGVSFYDPLAAAPTRDVRRLRDGARKALAGLEAIAAREGRPLMLVEVGYAPTPDAPVRPWEEGGGPPDLETQRACYEALVSALEGESWVAGACFWKWFSSPDAGGAQDASFTPRGKPAERVLRDAFRAWEGRRVSVPGPAGPRAPRSR